jgi:5-methylthioadenosine/S-adenosylhomocysteine deaminase
VDRSLDEHGAPVLRRVDGVGVLETRCICAHCVHLSSGEIRLAAQKGVGIAHNPSSNMKLASGLAPITEMLQQGCKVGIGTDGPASNNDLDMVAEMHLASLMAKVQTGDPTALPARTALLMATRLGAAALHMDHLTGSLEAGKRADLIVMDDSRVHSAPRFSHDLETVYGRVVYSCKSSDIQDVMCNGVWLMRGRELLTLDVKRVLNESQAMAGEIDAFIRRLAEDNLNKLITIGGVEQEQSFELQAKARLKDRAHLDELLHHADVRIMYERRYYQYDHYFDFGDSKDERIRYREDQTRDASGTVTGTRARLTYTSASKEGDFGGAVVLSRSRFIAPAAYPLRFYREYFNAPTEVEVEKLRYRWSIEYKGTHFYVNFDEMKQPHPGEHFLEIKSRTWSPQDAEVKAVLLREMLVEVLNIAPESMVRQEYVEMALAQK